LAKLIERGVTPSSRSSPTVGHQDPESIASSVHSVVTSVVANQRLHSPSLTHHNTNASVESHVVTKVKKRRPDLTAQQPNHDHVDDNKGSAMTGTFRGPAMIMEQNDQAETMATAW